MQIDTSTDSLSYWHATEPTIVPSGEMPTTAEVVVIGAGMLGCWTGYWLARAGANPVVVEKTAIGWGATGRNGGFLVGGAAMSYASLVDLLGRDNARTMQGFTLEGQELAHSILDDEGIECDLRRTGTLSLALNEESLQSIRSSQALLAEDGFDTQVLDRDGVQSFIDTPIGDEIVGGSITPSGGLLHSTRYLAGLVRAAENYGARFVRATVQSVTDTAVVTDIGTISTRAVVVALNAWTDDLIPEMAGVIVPTRGQILAYEPTSPVFRTALGTDITPTGEYWQQTPDGSIVIGGCRADAPNKDSGVRDMVSTPDVVAKIEAVVPRLFPELAEVRVARTWAGLMAFTPDYLPVVDQAENGAYFGGGFNGHGMPFGPVVGKHLATAALTDTLSPALRPLNSKRASLS